MPARAKPAVKRAKRAAYRAQVEPAVKVLAARVAVQERAVLAAGLAKLVAPIVNAAPARLARDLATVAPEPVSPVVVPVRLAARKERVVRVCNVRAFRIQAQELVRSRADVK